MKRLYDLLEDKRILPDGTQKSLRKFAGEIGMQHQTLATLIAREIEFGQQTLSLLMAWDDDFIEPGLAYMLDYGHRLRRTRSIPPGNSA